MCSIIAASKIVRPMDPGPDFGIVVIGVLVVRKTLGVPLPFEPSERQEVAVERDGLHGRLGPRRQAPERGPQGPPGGGGLSPAQAGERVGNALIVGPLAEIVEG